MENPVDVVTFRAWGTDLALPFEAVTGIRRAPDGLAVAEPPRGLVPGAGPQRFVQVATAAGEPGNVISRWSVIRAGLVRKTRPLNDSVLPVRVAAARSTGPGAESAMTGAARPAARAKAAARGRRRER